MSRHLRFSVAKPGCDRIHHVTEDDVRVVLGRLPTDVWSLLRAVHFNDQSRGGFRLGYANPRRLSTKQPVDSAGRDGFAARAPLTWGLEPGSIFSIRIRDRS